MIESSFRGQGGKKSIAEYLFACNSVTSTFHTHPPHTPGACNRNKYNNNINKHDVDRKGSNVGDDNDHHGDDDYNDADANNDNFEKTTTTMTSTTATTTATATTTTTTATTNFSFFQLNINPEPVSPAPFTPFCL